MLYIDRHATFLNVGAVWMFGVLVLVFAAMSGGYYSRRVWADLVGPIITSILVFSVSGITLFFSIVAAETSKGQFSDNYVGSGIHPGAISGVISFFLFVATLLCICGAFWLVLSAALGSEDKSETS